MTNNNPVVFDPQNQWAKELGASFIGSMAVIYFRDHWHSPQLDYLKREEAIQNCKDYCCLMRSMGYVAFVGYSSDDDEPQTVIVCNVPIDLLFGTCTVFDGYVIAYHTPCNNSVKVVSWSLRLKTVPNEPLPQRSYEPSLTSGWRNLRNVRSNMLWLRHCVRDEDTKSGNLPFYADTL